ncbi:MAG: hypothetical protein U9P50_02595 [Patescibacteria group bacterium]|nr:hypothetical protein [Patescibacteria group bacterium]
MNQEIVRRSILEGILSDENDFDFRRKMSCVGIETCYKVPEHIQADALVIGEKAKSEALFRHFSKTVRGLTGEIEEKDEELQAAKEQACKDKGKIQNLNNAAGHLRGKLGQTNKLLDIRNKTIHGEKAINENALRTLKEALNGSSPQICKRFQPVLEALSGNGNNIATDEEGEK